MNLQESIQLAESLIKLEIAHPKFQYLYIYTRDNLMYFASTANENTKTVTKLIESLNGKFLSNVSTKTMKVFAQFSQYLNSKNASLDILYDSIKLENVTLALQQANEFNEFYKEISKFTKEDFARKRKEVLVKQLNNVLHKIKNKEENIWTDYNNLVDFMLSCSSFGLLFPQYMEGVSTIVEYMEKKRLSIIQECKKSYDIYCFTQANSVRDRIGLYKILTNLRIIFFKEPENYIKCFDKVENQLNQFKDAKKITDREYVNYNTQLMTDYTLHGARSPKSIKPMDVLSRFIVKESKEQFEFYLALPFCVIQKAKDFIDAFQDNLNQISILSIYLENALKGSAQLRNMSIELYLGYLQDTRDSLLALYDMKYLTKEAYNYWYQQFIPSSDAIDEYEEFLKEEQDFNTVEKSTVF